MLSEFSAGRAFPFVPDVSSVEVHSIRTSPDEAIARTRDASSKNVTVVLNDASREMSLKQRVV